MQTETPRRETIRSRTTMSYAFEGALQPYLGLSVDMVPPLAREVVSALRNGYRTRPTWTVSKRTEPVAKRRRKGARK